MYQIYIELNGTSVCIYDDTSPEQSVKLINPKWTRGANAAGSLEFTMPISNVGYDILERLKSTIWLYCDGAKVWKGRVIKETHDFFKNRVITCEGALAFLNDTVIAPKTYTGTPTEVLTAILNDHNEKVADNRKLYPGTVTADGSNLELEANYTKSKELVSSLVSSFGGVIRTRLDVRTSAAFPSQPDYVETIGTTESDYVEMIGMTETTEEVVFVDWLSSYITPTNSQTIEFGKNLLDFSIDHDDTEFVTQVYVIGGTPEPERPMSSSSGSSSGSESGSGITIVVENENISSSTSSDSERQPVVTMVSNANAISEYGVIQGTVNFSDLLDVNDLTREGNRYLSQVQFNTLTLNLSAVDLHTLNPNIRSFDLLDKVHITSWAHGMDTTFAVIEITVPLDDPAKSEFTFADAEVPYVRRVKKMTQQTQVQFAETNDTIDRTADDLSSDILEESYRAEAAESGLSDDIDTVSDALDDEIDAREDADTVLDDRITVERDAIVETIRTVTTGYVFIDYNANGNQGIYISESPNITSATAASATKCWRWTSSGLGYCDGNGNWPVAITMDGKIKADYINTGVLHAEEIGLYGDLTIYSALNNQGQGTLGGYIGYTEGADETTTGVHIKSGSNAQIIATALGARVTYGNNHMYVTANGITLNAGSGGSVSITGNVDITGNLTVSGTYPSSGGGGATVDEVIDAMADRQVAVGSLVSYGDISYGGSLGPI